MYVFILIQHLIGLLSIFLYKIHLFIGHVTSPSVSFDDASHDYDVNTTSSSTTTTPVAPENNHRCPDGVACKKLGGECITCKFNKHCFYGKPNETTECEVNENIVCQVRTIIIVLENVFLFYFLKKIW